ncbi:MAG: hypothetical protein J1F11_13905 [Oscillospiraceae bacterium]|nr:hypothetical protein [Oscillospiraceae bacterium]
MKISIKIKAILLSVVCTAALTSCENKQENVPAVTSGETSETTAAAEVISGETSQEVSETPETSGGYPELEWLSREAEQKLREDYRKLMEETYDREIGYDVPIRYYYGTYSKGEVVVMDTYYGATDDENHFSVGDYEFYLPSGSYQMTLHMGSEFIPISEAYESGYVTDDDAAKIYYYSENSVFTDPVPEPLSEEADRKLREDFAEFENKKFKRSSLTADKVSVTHFYGTYDNGEVVVMYENEGTYTTDTKHYSVAGYDFYLSSGSFEIMLHNDSAFIPIDEAYQSGLLDDSDIEKIYYRGQIIYPYFP